MIERLRHTTLFAAYQTALVLGILTFPLALLTERLGMTPPIGRLVDRLDDAHERATEE
jgi:hypothetical protein